jgi:hypothetical protein
MQALTSLTPARYQDETATPDHPVFFPLLYAGVRTETRSDPD